MSYSFIKTEFLPQISNDLKSKNKEVKNITFVSLDSQENLDDLFINVEGLKYLSGDSFNLGFLVNFSEKDLRRIEVKKKDYFENNSHLMLVIYRLFSLYENTQDLRFLNLLLKLIDWMPIYRISEKQELRINALKIYEGINNSSN